jgi:hypothetical protein
MKWYTQFWAATGVRAALLFLYWYLGVMLLSFLFFTFFFPRWGGRVVDNGSDTIEYISQWRRYS